MTDIIPVLLFSGPQLDIKWSTKRNGFRNGIVPAGVRLNTLANWANDITVKRGKIHFHKSILYTESYNTATSANTWRFQFHTSPSLSAVRARCVVSPVDDPVAGTVDPRLTWTTTLVGGGSTTQDSMYHNEQKSGSTVVPDEMAVIEQVWDSISANSTYRAVLAQEDTLRIISATVWEEPAGGLAINDSRIIDPTPFYNLGPIYDADANDLVSKITTMWKRQRTVHITWCSPDDTYKTQNSTTWKNVVDGSTSGRSATSAGFTAYPNYCGSYESVNSGASTEGIPVTIWAYLKTDNASNAAQVRFVDSTGTLGTLTSTSTTGEWQSSNVTWTATTAATTEKIDIQVSTATGGGDTASVIAAGMYQYDA